MASRFWVGGSGNWDASDTTHWSGTSGGAGGSSVPTTSDTVTFDSSSGSATVTGTATMNCSSLTSSSANNTFSPGSNTINVAGTGTAWNWTGGTFTAGSSQITLNGAGVTFAGGTKTYNNVTLSGSGIAVITGTNTFGTLTRAGTAALSDQLTVPTNVTTTCNNFTATGNSTTNRLILTTSSTFSGPATISVSGTVSVTNTDLAGITGSGAASWDISSTSTGNLGGNSSVTLTSAQNNYWVGGTGSFSDVTNHWASSSGGSANTGRIPLPQDTAVFDANSFSGASQTATFDMPRLSIISCTSVTNNPTLSLSVSTTLFYGSITLCPSMTFDINSRSLQFHNHYTAASFTASTATISATSGSLSSNNQIAGATLTLADSFTLPGTGAISGFAGTLALASGITVTCPTATQSFGIFSMGNNSTFNLSATSGTIWNNSLGQSNTLGSGCAIVISTTSSSTRTFAGGGSNYPALTYTVAGSTGELDITGSNTFETINFSDVSNARTLAFTAGTTTTITSSFNVNGTVGKLMTIGSITASGHTLSKSSGTVSCGYLSISRSTATGGATWLAGAASTDGGNNSGWIFGVPPTSDTITVSDFPAPAYNGLQYVRTFTVDHTKVPNTNQSNFPVLVSGTYSYLATVANGGKVKNSNGYDIVFYSDASLTTKLSYEIDSYNATTGAVNFWVKLPTLSTSVDTTFYMAYGSASSVIIDQSDKTNVWDSNFKGVWHLPDGSNLTANDSTANPSAPTLVNTPTATTGKINGGGSFTGSSSQYIDTNKATALTSDVTVEAWVRFDGTFTNGVFPYIVNNLSAAPRNGFGLFMWSNDTASVPNRIAFVIQAAGVVNSANADATAVVGTTYHVVGVRSGTTITLYINGVAQTATGSGTLGSSAHDLFIASLNAEASRYWTGLIDEVRVSDAARSADWITTEYNNQNSPSTFYGVGAESLSINVNDTTAVTENVSRMAENYINKSESTTVTENIGQTAENYINRSDTTTVTDTPQLLVPGLLIDKSDSTTVTENIVITISAQISVSDSTTITDFPSPATTGYQYIRTFTIDHTKVGSSDSTNFPTLVSGTYSYLATVANGGKVNNANGYDIAFYSDANLTTKLDWETETYTASSGLVNFWVRIPTLSATVDTTFYMAYAKASNVLIDQSNRTGVWDSNFKAVYHLKDGSTLSASDSTSNAVNGTLVNTPTAATGQIGGAASLASASTQYIDLSTGFNPSAITYSAWIKGTTFPNAYNNIFGHNNPANTIYDSFYVKSNGKLAGYVIANANVAYDGTGTASLSTGTWYYVVQTYDSTNGLKAYVNGSIDATASANGPLNTTASILTFIGAEPHILGRYFNGVIDEARISSTARSTDWILAEYNNQNSPSTFYSASPELLLVNVFDTTSITDSASSSQAFQINKSDTISVTDTPILGVTELYCSVSDTTSITDNTNLTNDLSIQVNDSSSVTESLLVVVADAGQLVIAVDDTITITDTPEVHGQGDIAVFENTTVNELTIANFDGTAQISDSTTLTENAVVALQSVGTLAVNVSDNSQVDENILVAGLNQLIDVSDPTTITESTQVSITAISNLTISASDTINSAESSLVSIQGITDLLIAVNETTTITDSPSILIVAFNLAANFMEFFE